MGFFITYVDNLHNNFKECWLWETRERTAKHRKLIKQGKQKEPLTE